MHGQLRAVGCRLASYLNQPARGPYPHPPANLPALRQLLQPGDVLLMEGNRRISTATKYLTQSPWSHAAIRIGTRPLQPGTNYQPPLVDARQHSPDQAFDKEVDLAPAFLYSAVSCSTSRSLAPPIKSWWAEVSYGAAANLASRSSSSSTKPASNLAGRLNGPRKLTPM